MNSSVPYAQWCIVKFLITNVCVTSFSVNGQWRINDNCLSISCMQRARINKTSERRCVETRKQKLDEMINNWKKQVILYLEKKEVI